MICHRASDAGVTVTMVTVITMLVYNEFYGYFEIAT